MRVTRDEYNDDDHEGSDGDGDSRRDRLTD